MALLVIFLSDRPCCSCWGYAIIQCKYSANQGLTNTMFLTGCHYIVCSMPTAQNSLLPLVRKSRTMGLSSSKNPASSYYCWP